MIFDQTPLKHLTKNVKTVAISGLSYWKALTVTLGIILSNHSLPRQLIYAGKTAASYPKFDFPSYFSLSANEKHFSNTNE